MNFAFFWLTAVVCGWFADGIKIRHNSTRKLERIATATTTTPLQDVLSRKEASEHDRQMNLPDDNRTTKSSPTVHDTENTVISTGPKTSKNSTVSPQGRSFADFDALPVSPLGGYKTYEKSYVNMPGYHSAKEKVDGGGIQPQLVPAYGIPPPFYGQPNGGYRGPLVDNSIPTGVLPPYSAVGPAASSGFLEPGLVEFLRGVKKHRGSLLPPHCTCARLADCRDISALARGYDDTPHQGRCLPGFIVCCNPEVLDQLKVPSHPPPPPAVVAGSIPGPLVRLPPAANYVRPPLLPPPRLPIVDGPDGRVPVVATGPVGVVCGRKGRNPLGRVLDATDPRPEAEFGEYPWMAAVLLSDLTYMCGGALIGSRIVLTAAHCVSRHKNHNLIVRLGEYDVANTDEPPYQDIKVTDVVIHSGYHSGTLRNDIALIILEVPALFNEYISPVCLPEGGPDVGGVCSVSGWGKDTIAHGKWSSRLKTVDVPLVTNEFCQNSYRKSPQLGAYFNLADSFICAGAPGKDACYGDGGSPMVCSKDHNNESGYQLRGLVSWGVDCGQYPGVYVSVEQFVPWIIEASKRYA